MSFLYSCASTLDAVDAITAMSVANAIIFLNFFINILNLVGKERIELPKHAMAAILQTAVTNQQLPLAQPINIGI